MAEESEERLKRWSETWDKFFEYLEERRKAEANQEGRLTNIEEATLVNFSLIVRIEQNMDRLVHTVDRVAQTVDRVAQTQAEGFGELRASQSALFDQIDRFIRGQEGNGRKQ